MRRRHDRPREADPREGRRAPRRAFAAWPRTFPERLTALDFALLAIHSAAAVAATGRDVVLSPAQVSILADGAVELLTNWAGGEVDAEDVSAAKLERGLAGKPAILH